jgi:hypothetical protein
MTKHCHVNLHEHLYNKDIIIYLYVFGKDVHGKAHHVEGRGRNEES